MLSSRRAKTSAPYSTGASLTGSWATCQATQSWHHYCVSALSMDDFLGSEPQRGLLTKTPLPRLFLLNSMRDLTALHGPWQRFSTTGSPECSRQTMPVLTFETLMPRSILDMRVLRWRLEKALRGFHSPPTAHLYLRYCKLGERMALSRHTYCSLARTSLENRTVSISTAYRAQTPSLSIWRLTGWGRSRCCSSQAVFPACWR